MARDSTAERFDQTARVSSAEAADSRCLGWEIQAEFVVAAAGSFCKKADAAMITQSIGIVEAAHRLQPGLQPALICSLDILDHSWGQQDPVKVCALARSLMGGGSVATWPHGCGTSLQISASSLQASAGRYANGLP
jgi:hypothetical protein